MKFVIINDILYNPRYIKAIKPDKSMDRRWKYNTYRF